jgi:hypothetical protein
MRWAFLVNDSVNTFLPQRLRIEQKKNWVLWTRSAPGSYKEEKWGKQFSWALQVRMRRERYGWQLSVRSSGVCEDRTWEREAKESALLETVARERLVKTAVWKGLNRCWSYLWRLAIANNWPINPFTNPYSGDCHIYMTILCSQDPSHLVPLKGASS